MSKKEIDALMAAIPAQVKAAHAARSDADVKNTSIEAIDDEGYDDASVIICPSDYGFDMFGSTGADYIKERSREIAKQSLKVHAVPGSGTDHSTKGDFAPLKGGKHVAEVETAGILDGEDEKITDVDVSRKFGNTQGVN